MVKYDAKSVLVGRKRDPAGDEDFEYIVEVKIFNVNDPHKTTEVPIQHLEFKKVMSVVFKGHEIKYLPCGSDIVINDLEEINVTALRSKTHDNYKLIIE